MHRIELPPVAALAGEPDDHRRRRVAGRFLGSRHPYRRSHERASVAQRLCSRSQIGAEGFLLCPAHADVHLIWMADLRFALDLVSLDADRVRAMESRVQCCTATPCPIIQPLNTERSVGVLERPSATATEPQPFRTH